MTTPAVMTPYLANQVIGALLQVSGHDSYSPPGTLYLGLLAAASGTGSGFSFTEANTSYYTREAITWNTASGGVATNDGAVTLGPTTGSLGTCYYMGIFDAATSGNLLWVSQLLGDYGITAATSGASGTFTITGNQTGIFTSGLVFTVGGSTSNNGTYTVASSSYSSPNTTVTVTGSVTASTGTMGYATAPAPTAVPNGSSFTLANAALPITLTTPIASSSWSTYAANMLLEWLLNGDSLDSIIGPYWALATSYTNDSTLTEVSTSGTAYSRETVTFNTPANGQATSSAAISWPGSGGATGDFGTPTDLLLFDASTSGNLLMRTGISTSDIGVNTQLVIASGALVVAMR